MFLWILGHFRKTLQISALTIDINVVRKYQIWAKQYVRVKKKHCIPYFSFSWTEIWAGLDTEQ